MLQTGSLGNCRATECGGRGADGVWRETDGSEPGAQRHRGLLRSPC